MWTVTVKSPVIVRVSVVCEFLTNPLRVVQHLWLFVEETQQYEHYTGLVLHSKCFVIVTQKFKCKYAPAPQKKSLFLC